MKRLIHSALVLGLTAAGVSQAYGYSFLERLYGTPQLGLSARSRGMGGAGAALGNGAYSLVDNPGALILSRGTRLQLLGAGSRASENRFVPLFDTFDSFVDEFAIAVNDKGYASVLGGIVLDEWGENSVIVSAGVFDRYDARYNYWDERRTTLTSDEVINNLVIDTQGIIRSATLGAAYPIKGGHGFGAAVNYYFVDYKDRSAIVAQDPGSDEGEVILGRSVEGWSLTFGQVATVSERLQLGVTVETKPQLGDDYSVRVDGVEMGVETSSGDLEYPLRVQGGGTYRPRNDLKTTFAADVVWMGWGDLEESIPEDVWAAADRGQYPPVSLRDTWEVRFGLEHLFYNGLPARIGFRYGETYALEEADRVTFTFGFGYVMDKLALDLAGEVTKRNSRQEPLRPRDEQGPYVGAGRDRVEDTLLVVTIGASYAF